MKSATQDANYQWIKNGYGQKVLVNPHDYIGRKMMRYGFFDHMGLYYIEKILASLSNPIVFDVGANIGNHSLIMSRLSKMVYLFEPQKHIVELLQSVQDHNQIANWKIFNVGLSNETCQISLYQNKDGNNGKTTFVPELKSLEYSIEPMQVYRGDEIIKNENLPHVDFIKIDVEGLEAEVIAGLQQTITTFRPILMVEWNNEYTKLKFAEYDLFNQLFSDYVTKAIVDRGHYSNWYKKSLKWRQFFSRKKIKKENWMIEEFHKEFDYEHILFIPKEKMLTVMPVCSPDEMFFNFIRG